MKRLTAFLFVLVRSVVCMYAQQTEPAVDDVSPIDSVAVDSVVVVPPLVDTAAVRLDSVLNQLMLAGLPVLVVETVDGEMPTFEIAAKPSGCLGVGITNATKVPGRIVMLKGLDRDTVYDSGEYLEKTSGMTIKIRGNTSASGQTNGKYPYKIKLQKKADLLLRGDDGTYADKNWLLMRDDRLKALAGFWVNDQVGLQWTPQRQYVNVVFNGEYAGLYMLIESVERNKKVRIDVSSSGFLFEWDAYWWNEPLYVDSKYEWPPMNYTFKYPEDDEITEEQLAYFADMISTMENSVTTGDYSKYLDVESFAAWLLGHDILGNTDGAGSNYFLTKYDDTDGSRVMMAIMWDFDLVFYSVDKWDEVHNFYVFPSLLANNYDKSFAIAYAELWQSLSMTIVPDFNAFVDEFVASDVYAGFKMSQVWDNELYGTTWSADKDINRMLNWMASRKVWLDANVVMPSVPTVVEAHVAKPVTEESPAYNLLGQRVKADRRGLYIRGGKLMKAE